MPDTLPIDLDRYSVFTPPDPFEEHVGPFYFRIAGDARQAATCIACCRRFRGTATMPRHPWRRHVRLRRLCALPGGRPRRRWRHQHLVRHEP